ncbi:MAG: hypothetical protein KC516_00510 [Nanoarchaeota archaeon]|nr:hypothetical protein [Nanoarchaeota archaeon]
MKNKKANLLTEETLKIIVAVICLGILVYLAFAIYNSSTHDKSFVEAQSVMDRISLNLDELNNNAFYDGEDILLAPSGWILFFYSNNEFSPNQCYGENCLCLCEEVSDFFGLISDRQERECTKAGVCAFEEKLKSFEDIPIGSSKEPTIIKISKDSNGWVEVVRK